MDQREITGQGEKNPGGGEIFRSRPDRPWGPPSLLYTGYRVSFPGVKRPGRAVDHPPSSSARVKERVELYLYSPYGPSWPVLGRTLPLQTVNYIFTQSPSKLRHLSCRGASFCMPSSAKPLSQSSTFFVF
jgi:hypothetical protein